MSAPLSEHTVHVPPRQTCHVRANHPDEAASVVLSSLLPQGARDSLHLAVDPEHKLEPGSTSFAIAPTKTVYVEIGNCSDAALLCSFEIWGR